MIPTHNTEFILNILGYHIHHDPSPILLVQPTLDLAEAFSKDRLAPMVRDTPALHDKVKDARSRDSGNTLLHKKFPGGHITMAGANSPSSLASRPIRIVLCDEIDRYPFSAGTEGDPVKLAQKRSTTFYNRRTILVSTPTIEGASRIQRAFEESDQRFFHVPCPLCDGMQPLTFDRIKWEKDEKESPINVRYACSQCNQEFDDKKKDWMLLNGKWVATAPNRGIAGFHLSELYSPWRKWEETVAEFLEAKKSNETLKVWVNTALGETWKEKGEAPEWKRLYERRESYPFNRIPKGGLFLTAGVDVQKDRLEIEVVAWGRDKQSWSIDYRVIPGDTASEIPWAELDKVLMQEWPGEAGSSLPIKMLAVDSGFNTQHVYNWARKHPMSRVMAVKGVDTASILLGQPSPVDVTVRGRKVKRGFRMWPLGVSIAKSELYSWLRLEKPSEGQPFPPGYCHFPQYGEEFFEQITAEQLVTRIVRGFRKYEWIKTRDRNESLDCRIYSRVAASLVGLDRFSPEQWDALAGELGQVDLPQPKADPPPSNPEPRRKSTFW
jgi:phage terminase large subunit GpA-like protein